MSARQHLKLARIKQDLKVEEAFLKDLLVSLKRELMRYEIEAMALRAMSRKYRKEKKFIYTQNSKGISSGRRLSKNEISPLNSDSSSQGSEKSFSEQDLASSNETMCEDELDKKPIPTKLLKYQEDFGPNKDLACYNKITFEDAVSLPNFMSPSKYSEGSKPDKDMQSRNEDENENFFPCDPKSSSKYFPEQDVASNSKTMCEDKLDIKPFPTKLLKYHEDFRPNQDLACYNKITYEDAVSLPNFIAPSKYSEGSNPDKGMQSRNEDENENFFPCDPKSSSKPSDEQLSDNSLESKTKAMPGKKNFIPEIPKSLSKFSNEHIQDHDIKNEKQTLHEKETSLFRSLESAPNHSDKNISDKDRKSKKKGRLESKTSFPSSMMTQLNFSKGHTSNQCFENNHERDFKETLPPKISSENIESNSEDINEIESFIFSLQNSPKHLSDHLPDKDTYLRSITFKDETLPSLQKATSKVSKKHIFDKDIERRNEDCRDSKIVSPDFLKSEIKPLDEKESNNKSTHEENTSTPSLRNSLPDCSEQQFLYEDSIISNESEITFQHYLKSPIKSPGKHFSKKSLVKCNKRLKKKICNLGSLKAASNCSEKHDKYMKRTHIRRHKYKKSLLKFLKPRSKVSMKLLPDQNIVRFIKDVSEKKTLPRTLISESQHSKEPITEKVMKKQGKIMRANEYSETTEIIHENKVFFPYSIKSALKYSEKYYPDKDILKEKKHLNENETNYACLQKTYSNQIHVPIKGKERTCEGSVYKNKAPLPNLVTTPSMPLKKHLSYQDIRKNEKSKLKKETLPCFSNLSNIPVSGSSSKSIKEENISSKEKVICNEDSYEKVMFIPNIFKSQASPTFLNSLSNRSQEHTSNQGLASGNKSVSEDEDFFPGFLKHPSKFSNELPEQDNSSSDEDLNEYIAFALRHLDSPSKFAMENPSCHQSTVISNKGLHEEHFENATSQAESVVLDTKDYKYLEPLCFQSNYREDDADVEYDEQST